MAHQHGGKPDRDFLYQAYVIEHRGVLSIARELHVRNGTVVDAIREYGFSKRITRKWLLDHHYMQRQSLEEMASELGITEAAIRYHLRFYKIPIRYRSRGSVRVPELNDFDWLFDHYITQNLSQGRISVLLGCHEYSVSRACRRLGIPRKGRELCLRQGPAYRSNFSTRQRERVLERDGYRCQMPKCAVTLPAAIRLHAHHIVPRKQGGRNQLSNGITLCEACHVLTYAKEDQFTSLFRSIVASRHQEPPT